MLFFYILYSSQMKVFSPQYLDIKVLQSFNKITSYNTIIIFKWATTMILPSAS